MGGGGDNNRRRQETSLNGGTGGHKSWEKHAWQNCHGPTLLSENMYHLPPLPLSHIPPPSRRLAPVCSPLPPFCPAFFVLFETAERIVRVLCSPRSAEISRHRIPEAAHGIARFLFKLPTRATIIPVICLPGPFGAAPLCAGWGAMSRKLRRNSRQTGVYQERAARSRAPLNVFSILLVLSNINNPDHQRVVHPRLTQRQLLSTS